MSEVWPLDVRNRLSDEAQDALRPFRCVLLMPFERRFNQVADVIRSTVTELTESFSDNLDLDPPNIKRLDWVTSSEVIQQEIWQEIHEADLVFCDVTGYNPNVMFESGVCAAWKDLNHVVFIRDHFFKGQAPFDLAPIRYTEYELTTDGIKDFKEKIAKLAMDVLIGYPDRQGSSPRIVLPLEVDFKNNRDDPRIYTPPFAHRRVINEELEFGSLWVFSHSWASIGKGKFYNFALEFSARFSNPRPDAGYIGVGLRSQHYFANFAHILYLNRDGSIMITEPNEEPPQLYKDIQLRPARPIDLAANHQFRVVFNASILSVQVDDFSKTFQVSEMKKVFGPGLIRFQSHSSRMAISQVKVTDENSI